MKYLPDALAVKVGRHILIAQKHAPTILFGTGVVGVIGSTVLACRATLRLETTLEKAEHDLAIVREHADLDHIKRDTTIVYIRSALAVARLYGPSVVLGGASIAALTSSHNMLTSRNAALAAAYAAMERGFAEYRARVVEKYGEEEDRNLRYDAQRVQVVDPDTRRRKTINQAGPDGASVYARFFDQFSRSWSKEPEYNFLFLKSQQEYWTQVLQARGHVFLNEVYYDLGIPHTKAGAIVGWVITRNGGGDNYVDFGIYDRPDFVNGTNASVLLDFNVDGVIFDKIEKWGEALQWQK